MNRTVLLERIFSRIKKLPNGCWIWTGAKTNGYGVIHIDGRKGYNLLVHRVMLGFGRRSWTYGGLEPHHKCENTACVRPSHLKMVTHRENLMLSRCSPSAINKRKKRCDRGHLFTASTTTIYRRKRKGWQGDERICRLCRRITDKKWRSRSR